MKLWKSLLATILAVLLVASMSVCAFAYTDVPETDSYYEYISVVDSLGLIPANNVGDFTPNGYYTKGEALITAYRMINGGDNGLEDYRISRSLYDDVDAEDPLLPYINWAYDNSLITNDLSEKKFGGADPISGAEFLTLFVKVGGIDPTATSSGGGEDGEGGGEGGEGASSGDGAGTTATELVYPDSYIDAAFDFAGDLAGDEKTVSRKSAAYAIAQLLWYQDSETNIDMTTLTDDNGNQLKNFATTVYGLNKVSLNIRATANRNMGFDFNGDVLLSNGSILTTDEDLSKYIGHPITVTYRDMDRSGTLTEDEEIISYTVNSFMILLPDLSDISIDSYTAFTVSSIGLSFKITNASRFYYNDRLWGEDAMTNLIAIAGGTGGGITIDNRPNMQFTVVASEIFSDSDSAGLIYEVFVEEHRPAKIVNITDGSYTLYDYYARGTADEYVQFDAAHIVFDTASTAVGDYVNYYVCGDVCHVLDGSAVKTKIKAIGSGNILTLEDDTVVYPHQMFRRSDTIPELGKEVVVITEDVTNEYYLGWEYPNNMEKTPAMVVSETEKLDSVSFVIYDCTTKQQTTIEVASDNIQSGKRINEGEFIYYSVNGAGQYVVTPATITDKVKLGVETDTYFVESGTGKIYNKSKYYYGNLYTDTFKEDYYKIILDISGNVLALE